MEILSLNNTCFNFNKNKKKSAYAKKLLRVLRQSVFQRNCMEFGRKQYLTNKLSVKDELWSCSLIIKQATSEHMMWGLECNNHKVRSFCSLNY